jgi:glucose-6-phosphate isomerase
MKAIKFNGLVFDYSRTTLSKPQFDAFIRLTHQRDLIGKRNDMLSGKKINKTSNWSVLHTALRAKRSDKILVDGVNVVQGVHKVLDQMEAFSERVRSGKYRGYSGKPITDIVHIGIGGSYLGPKLITRAMAAQHHPRLTGHFVSDDIQETLKRLSPETTLFVVVSKTFTTPETLGQAEIAYKWFKAKSGKSSAQHFIGVTVNIAAAAKWGIPEENTFKFWDWVGGRYSSWSAVGITAMMMVGGKAFRQMLEGARRVDEHFRKAPFKKNIPVMMALIGIAHRNFMGYPAYASIPYPPQLEHFPGWLQQLDMESNGKSVELSGKRVKGKTGPIVFGLLGYDAQHSFFQWLHQGTDIVPMEFITSSDSENCIFQANVLFKGQRDKKAPQNNLDGGRPSTILMVKDITPETLGMLMALYEHKIFVQGALWGINSFDQCGVEMGKLIKKQLAKKTTAK